jgi:hypothetical protein
MFNKNNLHLEEITMKIEDRFKTEDSRTFPATTRISACAGNAAACAPKAKAERPLSDGRLRSLILGATIAAIAAMPGQSTILFKPVGRPPEVFAYKSDTMTKPLSNTGALNSPKLYFIFVGPNWTKDNTDTMIDAAKAILNSSYLSGLTQYGSDGHATYSDGDYTIDASIDPAKNVPSNLMWDEVGKYTTKFKSWLPGADGLNPPIYVVVHYRNNGTATSGGYRGYNNGPNSDPSLPYNAISVNIESVAQVDGFSWVLSHELVERISSGTGGLSEVSPGNGQIADGEPEGSEYYAWRVNGSSGPIVTSYWSFVDQAFIIPDGNLDRTLLVPVWNSDKWTGTFVSLQQGNLYQLTAPDQRTLIDTRVRSFAVILNDGTAQVFDLTADGQVKKYNASDSDTPWTPVTDSDTVASTLVGTSHLVKTDATDNNGYVVKDGKLYILGAKGGSPQVLEYNGTGKDWTAVTGSKYTVYSLAEADGGLYMIAADSPQGGQVFQYSGGDWNVITGPDKHVAAIASAGGKLYMEGYTSSYDGTTDHVWSYNSSDSKWEAVHDAKGGDILPYSIAAAGDVLVMLAGNYYNPLRVYQYGLTSDNWFPLTGTNTMASQILVQDGSELFMMAANDSDPIKIWQYSTPNDWTDLMTGTDLKTSAYAASVSPDNRLYVVASNDGGHHYDNWLYNGTPGSWSKK